MELFLIKTEEYRQLRKAKLKLQLLENGGVDNWQWYGESLNPEGQDYDTLLEDIDKEIRSMKVVNIDSPDGKSYKDVISNVNSTTDLIEKENELVEDWQIYIDKITEMLDSGEYSNSEDFLEGVLKWITHNHHITEKQMSAIDNLVTY